MFVKHDPKADDVLQGSLYKASQMQFFLYFFTMAKKAQPKLRFQWLGGGSLHGKAQLSSRSRQADGGARGAPQAVREAELAADLITA